MSNFSIYEWAQDGVVSDPSATEIEKGFECGPIDPSLMNWVIVNILNEIKQMEASVGGEGPVGETGDAGPIGFDGVQGSPGAGFLEEFAVVIGDLDGDTEVTWSDVQKWLAVPTVTLPAVTRSIFNGDPLMLDIGSLATYSSPITVISNSDADYGVITLVGNVITYTPNIGMSGTESITYTVEDAEGNQYQGTIDIELSETPVDLVGVANVAPIDIVLEINDGDDVAITATHGPNPVVIEYSPGNYSDSSSFTILGTTDSSDKAIRIWATKNYIGTLNIDGGAVKSIVPVVPTNVATLLLTNGDTPTDFTNLLEDFTDKIVLNSASVINTVEINPFIKELEVNGPGVLAGTLGDIPGTLERLLVSTMPTSTLSGSPADVSPNLKKLRVYGLNDVACSISDIPNTITEEFTVRNGTGAITGNVIDLNPEHSNLQLDTPGIISGDVGDIPPINILVLYGLNNTYGGVLDNLNAGIRYVWMITNGTITATPAMTFQPNIKVVYINAVSDVNSVNNMLIAFEQNTSANRSLTLVTGNAPTGAGLTAMNNMIASGLTISVT